METTFICGINLLVAVPTTLRSVWFASSLRKHPFLLALRRWGRFARSEEKRMFSQASLQATRPLKDHPRNTDIKCFVIFLDFHLRTSTATKKLRLSAANQNSRLSSYKNTNLILDRMFESHLGLRFFSVSSYG